jgi:hypothetical protein
MERASLEWWRGMGPEELWCEVFGWADVGEGVRRRSGVVIEVGEEVSVADA